MQIPEQFEILDGYARYRPEGQITFAEAVKEVADVITFSRENGIRRLLVDTTRWTGFGPPQTLDRFQMAEAFVRAAKSAVILAMVARPELIDPGRFGVTVARNRGLFTEVFVTETEAHTWLLDPEAK